MESMPPLGSQTQFRVSFAHSIFLSKSTGVYVIKRRMLAQHMNLV